MTTRRESVTPAHVAAKKDAARYVQDIMRAVAFRLLIDLREHPLLRDDVETVVLSLMARERSAAELRLSEYKRRMFEAQPIGDRSTPLVPAPFGDEPTQVGYEARQRRRDKRVPSGTFSAGQRRRKPAG